METTESNRMLPALRSEWIAQTSWLPLGVWFVWETAAEEVLRTEERARGYAQMGMVNTARAVQKAADALRRKYFTQEGGRP